MSTNPQPQTDRNRLWNIMFRLVNSDWVTVVFQGWELLQNIRTERTVGLYEVLDFEHTLELCDADGEKAIYRKRETVRLLRSSSGIGIRPRSDR